MQELATTHWSKKTAENKNDSQCRNRWIKTQCQKYFFQGGIEKFDNKEKEIRIKIFNSRLDKDYTPIENDVNSVININRTDYRNRKLRLLDVGSCYNPIGAEEMFQVTPIDIAPFSDQVLQCDFLNVILSHEEKFSTDGKSVEQLKKGSFDVVVFSLLLEYFPCPQQRFACCEKAYKLLKSGRILLIITPDSNHIGANAKFMKSWRYVLSQLGYMRIIYEKLSHLHCLAFRKCYDINNAVRWIHTQRFPENDVLFTSRNKIYIPQDFQTVPIPKELCVKVVSDPHKVAEFFEELPGGGSDSDE